MDRRQGFDGFDLNDDEPFNEQVRRECGYHRIGTAPYRVEVLDVIPGLFDLVEYRRNRKEDSIRPGYALRLTFQERVLAPFAIGYGAHFGLGQFRPEV